MAEVEYMVKTTDLLRNSADKDDKQLIIERMKIEDEVFHKFNVEMEHILVTRRENKGNQEQDPNSSGANLDTTAESIPLEINELE